MPIAELNGIGAITGAPVTALAGITDMVIFHTAEGPALITATRGGGRIVSYDLGSAPGAGQVSDSWAIPSTLSQLESTDLAILEVGGSVSLLMAGLDAGDMQALSLNTGNIGNLLANPESISINGVSAQNVADIAVTDGAGTGIIALRGGGLYQVDAAGGSLVTSPLTIGGALQNASVSDLAAGSSGGSTYAIASYWSENAISLFEQNTTGDLQHIGNFVAAPNSAWFAQPMAAGIADIAGQAYAVIAASGSSSLTVLALDQGGTMVVTDHILDTRDTRFDAVSAFDMAEIGGREYVFAAGADDGLSVMVLLPGGRLHHVATIEGSLDLPLAGITGIEVLATDAGARIFVTTQSAPYLSEISFTLPNMGQTHYAADVNSTLTGSTGADILAGGAGDDSLTGGSGDDILLDGSGADTLTGGAGADDFLLSNDGQTDVILDFQAGIDRIDLTALDMQWDFSAIDVIERSWGVELHFGDEVIELHGFGGATLTASDIRAEDFVSIGHVTYTGDGLIELPTWQAGSQGNDTMTGGAEADRITGLGGHDQIDGGQGDDTLMGEAGEDLLQAGGGNDSVEGGGNNDTLYGGGGFDTIHGDDGNDVIFGDAHADELHGGSGDDVIEGGDGYDWLFGGDGNDTLDAGATPDRVYGGDGDDLIYGGSNFSQTVDGLYGEAGNDTIYGGAGFDNLLGGTGDDHLDGGHQADNLFGEEGNDTLYGDLGLDRLFGGVDNDLAFGGDGNDGLFGESGHDTLYGEAGQDRFYGGTGNDALFGGSGQDTLYGGAGFDTLHGGLGNDVLQGNFNADTFVFAAGHGQDTITDFDATNPYEVIDFSYHAALNELGDILGPNGAAQQQNNDVFIDTGGGNSILLLNVDLDDLDASDFIF